MPALVVAVLNPTKTLAYTEPKPFLSLEAVTGEVTKMAGLKRVPLATEALRRIDQIFAIEREINGRPPDERRCARHRNVLSGSSANRRWNRVAKAGL